MTEEITTILIRLDKDLALETREAFDNQVNAALKDGWKLLIVGCTETFLWAVLKGEPLT